MNTSESIDVPKQSTLAPSENSSITIQPSFFTRLFFTRLNRSNFALGLVLIFIAMYAIYLFLALLFYHVLKITDGYGGAGWGAYSLTIIVVIVYFFSLLIRRLHDIGRTGWWVLLVFITGPFFLVLILGLCFWPGQSVSNRYGNPLTKKIDLKKIIGIL